MDRRGLAAGAIALGIAGFLAAPAPRADVQRTASLGGPGMLGSGSPEALLATPLPTLRFSVPAGGHASLRLGLLPSAAGGRAFDVELALVALLGVPGEWPLDGALGLADAAPALETSPTPVPEPGSLALLWLGAAGLAGGRAFGRREPAGRDPARLSP